MRMKIWKLFAPYADYIRHVSFPCEGEAQYDKVPALLFSSRVVSSEYSVELYGINRVLRIVIHANNHLLTSYNSLLQGSKSNVDFSRFKFLRIDFRFSSYQNLTLSQHLPGAQHNFPCGQLPSYLNWFELYENRFRGI